SVDSPFGTGIGSVPCGTRRGSGPIYLSSALADGGDSLPGMHSQRRRSVRLARLRWVIGTAHHGRTRADARQIKWRLHTLYRYAGRPLPATLRGYRTRATCRARLSTEHELAQSSTPCDFDDSLGSAF